MVCQRAVYGLTLEVRRASLEFFHHGSRLTRCRTRRIAMRPRDIKMTKACLRTAEVEATVDQWGLMCPAGVPLQHIP